ncbi:uncharacterized protein I303_106926 [Kwoniella dejecticola CBS 10117]|uniref:Cupin type-2 domain-containing protein n=1 Tax=Kwoniella dejecticola CBS 10117 TaxID=1296121 RepID=A0A1A5ZTB3_9TREE|nr:uncharacterized protein I303_08435 [Kwoniella dejecticola CBS 10117]OBR81053.1 hypothetical protein I303_08435 [Kwoniella dejecticola CBS 10117]
MSTPEPASRYITGHDQEGRAVFQFEGPIEYTSIREKSGRDALFGVAWKNDGFPVDNQIDIDQAVKGGPIHNEKGTIVRIVEFPPQSSSPAHRTVSLDYGIMVSGIVHLELEDGDERRLVPGDIAVQRGTVHTWHNRTDEYARMVFVLVAAKPVIINGQALGDNWE